MLVSLVECMFESVKFVCLKSMLIVRVIFVVMFWS